MFRECASFPHPDSNFFIKLACIGSIGGPPTANGFRNLPDSFRFGDFKIGKLFDHRILGAIDRNAARLQLMVTTCNVSRMCFFSSSPIVPILLD